MVQQATTSSLQEAIRLHLEPSIIWAALPRLLDLISHVVLLASKLRNEIRRIRELEAGQDGLGIGMEHRMALTGIYTMCQTVEDTLWRRTLGLRELGVAAALSSPQTDLKQLAKVMDVYWPTSMDHVRLYIRAMPEDWQQAFRESAQRAKAMYEEEKLVREGSEEYEAIVRDKEAEVDSANTVLEATNQIFEYIALTEKILAKCSDPTSRESRRLSIPVKPEIASPIKTTSVLHDNDSRAERSDRHRSKSRADREEVQVENVTSTLATQSTSAQVPTHPGLIAQTAPTKQKRSRPSFPPREGPDYTRPLPTPSDAVKKQRLHPFKSSDLR